MRRQSLQAIEDHYVRLGCRGDKLRLSLKEDKEYQQLLRERKKRLSRQSRISKEETIKYVLSTDDDFRILAQCKSLERVSLDSKDKMLIKLVKSQLESDWRKPLLKTLDLLEKKYKLR